jgi:phosphoglycolate phosphatase-like HAD superfamily hydrolase
MWELWEILFEAYPYYGYGETPKNFRQVWNHPFSYPVFHWVIAQLLNETSFYSISNQHNLPMFAFFIATKDGIYESLIEHLKDTMKLFVEVKKEHEKNKIEKGKEDKKITIDQILQKFEENPIVNWLLNDIKGIHRGVYSFDLLHTRYYEAAVNNYWNVQYKPFRQIREVLRTLRDILGVKLYVATEGHHDTQVRKINSLGLLEFFPEPVILSTEAAARQRDERLKDIQELEDDAQKAIAVFEAHFKKLKLPDKDAINNLIEEYRQDINHLRNLYQNQWEEFLHKNAGAIYTLIVASIIVNSENPFYEMTRLDELERQLSGNTLIEKKSMFFAMIGDREKKDISPLLNNFRKTKDARDCLCAIRLFTLDHMDENIYWEPTTEMEKQQALKESKEEQNQKRAPADYVVWNHHQAVLFLANYKNWKRPVQYAILPPIIPGRLAEPDGKIIDEILDAMYFGSRTAKNMRNGGFAFTLINYLVVQATVRDGDIDTLRLIDNIIERMHDKRKVNEEYKFLWDRIHRIWYFSREMESEKAIIGRKLFQMIYQELQDDPNYDGLQGWAVNLLREIKGSFIEPENQNDELFQMFNDIENRFNNQFHRSQVTGIINNWN